MNIQPTSEHLDQWIDAYVPEKDLFFLPEKELVRFEEELEAVFVIPKDEFFNHKSYNQIQLVNSYEYWCLSKDVHYVLVAAPDWVSQLSVEKKKQLFQLQMDVGRGLIYPISISSFEPSVFQDYIIEANNELFFILQRGMWDRLPKTVKRVLMKDIAIQWDDWTSESIPEHVPLHLKKFANQFPLSSVGNCFSSALFPITKQEWMIYEWVHPKTFFQSLKRANYVLTSSQEVHAGDIVIWEDEEGVAQHAAYHIGEELFFNKNGQTFFNPWTVVGFSKLKEKWNKFHLRIYRKTV